MSCHVTAVYAEDSTLVMFPISGQATVQDLKQRACSELTEKAKSIYKVEDGFPFGAIGSIVLSSKSHGQHDFQPSTVISSLCKADEHILATVPAPVANGAMAAPIYSHFNSMFDQKVQNIEATFREELKEALKAERKEREDELKAALKAERKEREEALNAERRRREEALKEALKENKEERDAEREEWEEALKVEREKQKLENERLQRCLLDVQEMALDNAGWLAGGQDRKLLDRIKLRHLLTKAQERLALIVRLTHTNWGASLAWRDALGPSDVLSTRLGNAFRLLGQSGIDLDQSTRALMDSADGMRLVVEAKSVIRDRGDQVAHPEVVPRAHFEETILRNPINASGLRALADFVCSRPS